MIIHYQLNTKLFCYRFCTKCWVKRTSVALGILQQIIVQAFTYPDNTLIVAGQNDTEQIMHKHVAQNYQAHNFVLALTDQCGLKKQQT